MQFSGSAGTVVKTTSIATYTKRKNREPNNGEFVLSHGTLIGAGFNDKNVHFWHYPKGGLPERHLAAPGARPYGITLSVAPSAHTP